MSRRNRILAIALPAVALAAAVIALTAFAGHDSGTKSDRRLRLAIAALSALGAAVATYLTVVELTDATPVCGTGGCAIVEHSKYSELLGIPTASFGIALWTALIATTLSTRESVRTAGAAIAPANDALASSSPLSPPPGRGSFGALLPAGSGRPARP